MRGITTITLIVAATAAAAFPASAETWRRFSASDSTVYLIDEDSLTPVEGVVTAHFARVPSQGAENDLSHRVEEILFRCSASQSRTMVEISYGEDGTEAERETVEADWEPASDSGLYGAVKSLACNDMRSGGQTWPSVAAFVAGGRKAD